MTPKTPTPVIVSGSPRGESLSLLFGVLTDLPTAEDWAVVSMADALHLAVPVVVSQRERDDYNPHDDLHTELEEFTRRCGKWTVFTSRYARISHLRPGPRRVEAAVYGGLRIRAGIVELSDSMDQKDAVEELWWLLGIAHICGTTPRGKRRSLREREAAVWPELPLYGCALTRHLPASGALPGAGVITGSVTYARTLRPPPPPAPGTTPLVGAVSCV